MEEYNPWWLGEPDPLYEEWLTAPVKWVPRAIHQLSLKPFSLNFLVGPRQVGKTTALKILAHMEVEKLGAKAVFYYSCDELSDYRELGEVLDTYLSARKAWGVKNSLILLDEVTFVEEWFRALKARIDRGSLKKDVLVVTGSASIDLFAGKERFPGRRGHGRDVYMYPLSFGDYVEVTSQLRPSRCLPHEARFPHCLKANKAFESTLQASFNTYLKTGGFPLPLREYAANGRVSPASYKAYLDWVRADWAKAGRSDKLMKEVIAYLLETAPSPISWSGIARHTSLGSPNTAREYVETLEKLMAAKIIYWSDLNGKVNYRKNKKIHFIDPFLYHVFEKYTRTKALEPAIVEAAVATHMARLYPVTHWRNSSEIDVIALTPQGPLRLEVKWRPHPHKHIHGAQVLDKKLTPIFLASIGPPSAEPPAPRRPPKP